MTSTFFPIDAINDLVCGRVCDYKTAPLFIGNNYETQKQCYIVFKTSHNDWYNQNYIVGKKRFRNRLMRKHYDGQIPKLASYLVGVELEKSEKSENNNNNNSEINSEIKVSVCYGDDILCDLELSMKDRFKFIYQNQTMIPLDTIKPISLKYDTTKAKLSLYFMDFPYYGNFETITKNKTNDITIVPIQTYFSFLSDFPTINPFGCPMANLRNYYEEIKKNNIKSTPDQILKTTEFLKTIDSGKQTIDFTPQKLFLNDDELDCTDQEVINEMK